MSHTRIGTDLYGDVCDECSDEARAYIAWPCWGAQGPLTPQQEAPILADNDAVNHPGHYTSHPSGIECIAITEHMNFNVGNAVKYLWRADEKGNALEDLQKAAWYVQRELDRRAEL